MDKGRKGLAEMAEQKGARSSGILPLPVLLVFAACMLWGTPVQAGLNLLWIQNLTAGVGGGYNFSESGASAGGGQGVDASRHRFSETFSLSGDYSLLTPRFAKGSAGVDLRLTQQREKDRHGRVASEDLHLDYSIAGVFFPQMTMPVSFVAGSHISNVSPPFSASYEVHSDDFSVTANLKNAFLPAQLTVGRNISQSSGLSDDRRQSSDTLNFQVEHKDGAFSLTNLNLRSLKNESSLVASGSSTSDRQVRAAIANSLKWQDDRNLTRTLSSNYSYDASAGFQRNTSQNLSSNFKTQLGKTLDAGAGYFFESNKSDDQTLQSQTATVNLSHRLYDSLVTTVSATGSSSRYTDGQEDSYGGGGGVNYTYRLSPETQYSLSYNISYSVADRRRSGALSVVEDEHYPVPTTDPRRIALRNPTFLAATVRVAGVHTLTPYLVGVDYTVTAVGIELIPGRVQDETELFISYSFPQDPRLVFASIGQGLAGRLGLDGTRHAFYFNAHSSDQQLLSGVATEVTLSPTYHLDFGYEYNLDTKNMHAEYGWNKNFATNLHYLDTSWRYRTPFRSGSLSSSASDYLNYTSQGGSGGNWSNSLNLSSSYNTSLSEAISATLGGSYLNSFSDAHRAPMSNLVSANLLLDGHFGRTTVTLTSNMSWSLNSSAASHSESVGLSFVRFF